MNKKLCHCIIGVHFCRKTLQLKAFHVRSLSGMQQIVTREALIQRYVA